MEEEGPGSFNEPRQESKPQTKDTNIELSETDKNIINVLFNSNHEGEKNIVDYYMR
jgi:hypothetical protein